VDWYYTGMNLDKDNFGANGGHVKHAFRAAFYHLRRRSTAEEAFRDVLRRGGDTDTNACIVGGLLGALHGYDLIPDHLKGKVLTFDCTKEYGLNHRRPHTYSVGRCFRLVEHMAPFQEPVVAPSKVVRVVKMEGAKEEADEETSFKISEGEYSDDTKYTVEELRTTMTEVVERIAAIWETGAEADPNDWFTKEIERHVGAIISLVGVERNLPWKNLGGAL